MNLSATLLVIIHGVLSHGAGLLVRATDRGSGLASSV